MRDGAGRRYRSTLDPVRSIARGDQLAFAELYFRSYRLVYALIMLIVASRESAEELTLNGVHEIWRRARKYHEEGGTVLGWIVNQARSRAIDRVRFEHRKKQTDPLPGDAAQVDGTDTSDDQFLFHDHRRRL